MKSIAITLLSVIALTASAQDYAAGEKIFKGNCAACHKMDSKLIGPPLQNTVAEQGFEWTKKWIYDNQALRDAGDQHAIEIFEEYKQQVMPAYSYLSDEELTNLVTYLEEWSDKQAEPAVASGSEDGVAGEQTVAQAPAVKRELSKGGKIVLGIMAFSVLMIAITIIALYRAFKTMVEVNRDLHKKVAT